MLKMRQMERIMRQHQEDCNGNVNYYNNSHQFLNGFSFDSSEEKHPFPSSFTSSSSSSSSSMMTATTSNNSSSSSSSSSSCSANSGGGGGGGVSFIEHSVSKLDTLAGVAIKYGVEVSDIKKMNGLVTDLQMFGLKTLQIPLPGRHPPSPCLPNGSDIQGQSCCEQTPPRRSDLFDSFQSLRLKSSQRKVSPAMSCLQGYYGLKPTADSRVMNEGCEMAVYSRGNSHCLEDGGYKTIPASHPHLSLHWKSSSLINGFPDDINGMAGNTLVTEGKESDSEKWNDKLFRRRQKSETDFTSNSEMLLREDNNSGGAFSAITGKGLAMRPKASSRMSLPTDTEAGALTTVPTGSAVFIAVDGLSGVRKSSSTSSLNDQESSSSSIWPTTKWSLKPDLQVLSAAAIARPIFDGLPKPITGRKNKAALD